MPILYFKMLFTFSGLFLFGINPYQQKKPSTNAKEMSEAYSKK